MSSHVGEYFPGDTAASDHKPVVATYALAEHTVVPAASTGLPTP